MPSECPDFTRKIVAIPIALFLNRHKKDSIFLLDFNYDFIDGSLKRC